MKIQITIQVDGRQVQTLEQNISGDASEREEQAHRLGKSAGRVVAEKVLEEAARTQLGCPRCCGKAMSNRGRTAITIQALDGPIKVHRTRYRCPTCGRELYPADGLLLCGRHRITKPLAKRACQLATVEHFTELPRLLFDQHGVCISHEELIELVHDVGGEADRLRRAEADVWLGIPATKRHWPDPKVQPQRVYVSCDGIMYCPNQREPDPQHPGQNRLIWQQMKVGCVYWQDDKEEWHKEILWGRENVEEFGASLYRLACCYGYRDAEEKIFAADGGDWCWSIHSCYFADATGVLDWYHASEHVWSCAKVLHSQAADVKAWVNQALTYMQNERGSGLLRWLLELQPKSRGKKRKAITALIHYVQPRQDRMDYPTCRDKGWQIGTGMIESTAKQLVGLRLKGPGMHWSESGTIAMTALRAHSLNHHWHRFWKT